MDNKESIIGMNLNDILKLLYQYKQFGVCFKTSEVKWISNDGYLHCKRSKNNYFYHFKFEMKYNEAIITKVMTSNWNIHKLKWYYKYIE